MDTLPMDVVEKIEKSVRKPKDALSDQETGSSSWSEEEEEDSTLTQLKAKKATPKPVNTKVDVESDPKLNVSPSVKIKKMSPGRSEAQRGAKWSRTEWRCEHDSGEGQQAD